ncbi:MAG: ATP-binding protein [Flavobacteriales bacterium]|nr:ATP-binding protein [Flavobacteriales bacterium]
MISRYKQWVDNLIPSGESLSPEDLRKRRLFINVVVFTFFNAFFYIPICIWFDYDAGLFSVILTLAVLPVSLIMLKKRVSFTTCVHVYLIEITSTCIFLMYFTGGLMGSPFTSQWMSVPFLLAVLIGFRKIAAPYLIISIAAMAYFGISEVLGYDFVLDMNPQYVLTFNTIAQTAFLLVVFLIALTFDTTKRKAYNELNKMQDAFVQQEKMASLGTLTAGIAHEIKNPLNFVNNFSELSSSLIDEIKNSDNKEEVDELLADLKLNLEKINQHGKRADSIVKSMLQHSRSSAGDKQPTDINKICDEFLDLAFHSMRANVSNFNCSIEKAFDPALPIVNVVQQDISRVLLNLLNNAFYAVKTKADAKVVLSTKKIKTGIEISVRDNGTGIPEKVRENIFEPFFTTKPTGEGTGLGLSICYDIIKAHGGELRVQSKEGEFTEFTISLPI